MTIDEKRRIIREGIASRLDYNCEGCMPKAMSCIHPCEYQYDYTDKILLYQDSMGIAIIEELPSVWNNKGEMMSALDYKKKLFTHPLIEEEK